jgi:multiple antibiotic resistance protein
VIETFTKRIKIRNIKVHLNHVLTMTVNGVFVFKRERNLLLALSSKATMAFIFFCMMSTGASAQPTIPVTGETIYFPISHIVTFLFLMLGPTKIIGPFLKVTEGADRVLEKAIARNAIIFSGIALFIAGLLGEMILKKHSVPLPVLALAAGLILFLVAVQDTVRQFSFSTHESTVRAKTEPSMKLALDPLAFPVIVTPYGIAALIVFLSFAADVERQFQIGMIVVAILLLNFLTMLFARKVLAGLGIVLAILGAVLSVVQVALGLQIIRQSLMAMGAF